jgi:hypothetical protein
MIDISASKLELDSITEFQKEMHFVSKPNDPLSSKFYKEYLKTTWYCSASMPLSATDNEDNVIYSPNPSFHYLTYSYLRFMLPPIKVKPKFKNTVKIAWCHNIGTNIVKMAYFKEDDLDYQQWDNIWADDYFQFYMQVGADKRRNHEIGIGSVPILEEWTDTLPSYPINVDQPWYYGEETAHAYPIFMKNSQARAQHIYNYRRKISDLLRMQVLDPHTDTWVNVIAEDFIQKYLNVGKHAMIQKPTLWGRYAYITDTEINSYKCLPENKTRVFYIKDIEICDSKNPNKYGTTSDIPLECSNPCLAMFWKTENMDATKYNNYSNYTCNSNDLHAGWDPITKQTLKYGNKNKFRDMESDHFNVAESRKHFLSSPNEIGYHAYSFAWHSYNFGGEVGITLSNLNAKLICNIANNDIYNVKYKADIDEQENQEYTEEDTSNKDTGGGPEFTTRVRLLIIKKLTITRDDAGIFTFSLC